MGLIGEVNALGSSKVAPPLPRLPLVAPMRNSRYGHARLALPGIQRKPHIANRLARFIEGEPPLRPCSPLPRFMLPAGTSLLRDAAPVLSIKRGNHPTPHSCHTSCLRCAPQAVRQPRLPALRAEPSSTVATIRQETCRRIDGLERCRPGQLEPLNSHPAAGCAWPCLPFALSRYGPPHPPPTRPASLGRGRVRFAATKPRPALTGPRCKKQAQSRGGAVAPPPAKVSPPLEPPSARKDNLRFSTSRKRNPSLSIEYAGHPRLHRIASVHLCNDPKKVRYVR
jgi:hypothetical protein